MFWVILGGPVCPAVISTTIISRHHGNLIYGPPETPLPPPSLHHSPTILKGLRGALNYSSIMPRDASLSNNYSSGCCFFQSAIARAVFFLLREIKFCFLSYYTEINRCQNINLKKTCRKNVSF